MSGVIITHIIALAFVLMCNLDDSPVQGFFASSLILFYANLQLAGELGIHNPDSMWYALYYVILGLVIALLYTLIVRTVLFYYYR